MAMGTGGSSSQSVAALAAAAQVGSGMPYLSYRTTQNLSQVECWDLEHGEATMIKSKTIDACCL